jgi:hypothetical protein
LKQYRPVSANYSNDKSIDDLANKENDGGFYDHHREILAAKREAEEKEK